MDWHSIFTSHIVSQRVYTLTHSLPGDQYLQSEQTVL